MFKADGLSYRIYCIDHDDYGTFIGIAFDNYFEAMSVRHDLESAISGSKFVIRIEVE